MTAASFVQRVGARLTRLGDTLQAPAPVRPTVLIQSDDWGNAGLPSVDLLAPLRQRGMPVPVTPWDSYGLETGDDLQALGELLQAQRDADGKTAVMSAVTVVANADVLRMQAEGYREFHAVPVWQGLPAPWAPQALAPLYRQLVDSGVWYPVLHGYTHLNTSLLLTLGREDSPRGERVRALHALGIPYLTSQTPEFIFALFDRSVTPERFLPVTAQRAWLNAGLEHFERLYGRKPYSTCAPGYRFNDDTCALWAEAGIAIAHSASPFGNRFGVWNSARNVFFEPVLYDDALPKALAQAEQALARGEPLVICTHSINYVSRHVGKAAAGRAALATLLDTLRQRHPALRFADEETLHRSLLRGDPDWWRSPRPRERLARLAA